MSSSDNIHGHTPPQTAGEFLLTANATLAERGKQYDAGGKQERSMGKAVAAFNAIHDANGAQLTEAQGWAFMAILKLVRGAHKPHADSALDLVGYSALYAECVAGEFAIAASSVDDTQTIEPSLGYALGQSAETSNLREALHQCALGAATMARNCALTMPSAVTMAWVDEMQKGLQAVMTTADEALR